jgi:hypothetical protein
MPGRENLACAYRVDLIHRILNGIWNGNEGTLASREYQNQVGDVRIYVASMG